MEKAKIVSLFFGIFLLTFLIGFYILAWKPPTELPPGANIPAPLNVGPEGQKKEGGLVLNTGGASNGLIVAQGKVGIGTLEPDSQAQLDVAGTVKMKGFQMPTGASAGYVLTSDNSGVGTWQPVAAAGGGISGSGTANYLAKFKDSASLENSIIYEKDNQIGIGTPYPKAKLHAGREISNYGNLDFTNTGAVITSIGVTQKDSRTNVLTLMRSGDSNVEAGAARFDLSRWWTHLSYPYVQLDIALSHYGTNDLKNVMSLRANGNVGIGTTTPEEKLHISGGNIILENSGETKILFGGEKTGEIIERSYSESEGYYYLNFYAGLSDAGLPIKRMVIRDDGKVGIGTTKLDVALNVEGSIQATRSIYAPTLCLGEKSVQCRDSWPTGGGGNITGSGTANYLAKFTGPTSLGTSIIYEKVDNYGTKYLGIDTADPKAKLHIKDGDIMLDDMKKILFGGKNEAIDRSCIGSYLGTYCYLNFYTGGTRQMVIRSDGKVGIGVDSPNKKLEVKGYIKATGICIGEDREDCRTSWPTGTGGGGVSYWIKKDNYLYPENTNWSVAIGKTTADTKLDVKGTVKMEGFQMPTGASEGYVLTSDADGKGTWKPPKAERFTVTNVCPAKSGVESVTCVVKCSNQYPICGAKCEAEAAPHYSISCSTRPSDTDVPRDGKEETLFCDCTGITKVTAHVECCP